MLHKLNAIVAQGYCSKWAMKTSLAKRYMYWKSKVLQDEPSLQSRRILQRDPWSFFENNAIPLSWTLFLAFLDGGRDQGTSKFPLRWLDWNF